MTGFYKGNVAEEVVALLQTTKVTGFYKGMVVDGVAV